MKTNRRKVSRALTQVWEWREAINREVAHLPPEEALRAILEMSRKAGEEFTRRKMERTGSPRMAVAERGPDYGTTK